ncbi:MAG: prepilin peptidase [Verrucomicrobia bacterium]|nr:prepilin peptidase [Verrucomicrobiota bacterium]
MTLEALPVEFLTLVAVAFGACIGSFLNVCIWRIPRDESVVHPGSHCPKCGRPIAWFDNIPLVSWVALRARCRACGAPISPRYVLVEALVAVLFGWIAWRYGWDVRTPLYCLVAAGLVLATFIDLDEMYIPDRVSLGGIAAGLVLSLLWPGLHGGDTAFAGFRSAAVGALAGSGSLATLAWVGTRMFGKEAMGMGDVKLLGAIGAFLGWQGVAFTFFVSAFAGAAVGLTMIAMRRKELQSAIPFGPYLALGAIVWMLGGDSLWIQYLRFMTHTAAPGFGG